MNNPLIQHQDAPLEHRSVAVMEPQSEAAIEPVEKRPISLRTVNAQAITSYASAAKSSSVGR